MNEFSASQTDQALDKLAALEERVRQVEQITAKWGRMLNALIGLLEKKNVATKSEVTTALFDRLRDSGALERAEACEETS